MLPQRSKHPRETVITPKASTSIFAVSRRPKKRKTLTFTPGPTARGATGRWRRVLRGRYFCMKIYMSFLCVRYVNSCMPTYRYVSMWCYTVYIYIHTCIYMYTYIYIYIDLHIYIYVYIHNICIDVYREGPKGFSVIHLSP